MAMILTSPAFDSGQDIPAVYSCEGKNISPPLQWSGAPPETRSYVLIADDPDAPDPKAPRTIWVHWIVYNIPVTTTQFPEAVSHLPSGARQGVNDFHNVGYGGPCPPIGRHRYFFRLYALNSMLPDLGAVTRQQLERKMTGHVLEEATIMGGYRKRH